MTLPSKIGSFVQNGGVGVCRDSLAVLAHRGGRAGGHLFDMTTVQAETTNARVRNHH
jgi:hypothetical protein